MITKKPDLYNYLCKYEQSSVFAIHEISVYAASCLWANGMGASFETPWIYLYFCGFPVGVISESVHKSISNKPGINSRFAQEKILKNVKEAVRIYEVTVDQSGHTSHANANNISSSMKEIPEKSIAVLPFVNMCNDPEQDYFGDGPDNLKNDPRCQEIINRIGFPG